MEEEIVQNIDEEIDFDYQDSPEEIEFRRKIENPFHLLQKGDYWVASEEFCLKCGQKSFPFIVEKIVLEKIEKADTEYTYDNIGRKMPRKGELRVQFKYCEILECSHESCREIFFRIYEIYENATLPKKNPRLIPARLDKFPITNLDGSPQFSEIHRRYLEAVDAFNSSLFFAAGVSIRSVLEILCKNRGHFQNVINKKTYGKTYTIEQLEKLKRSIGLEEQVKLFIQEIQAIAPEKFAPDEIAKIKLMMYWGHGIVHGSTDPTEVEIKSGLEVLEEIFRVLYFDPIEEKAMNENRQQRKRDFASKISQFDTYQK